jgi:hypothetical protein
MSPFDYFYRTSVGGGDAIGVSRCRPFRIPASNTLLDANLRSHRRRLAGPPAVYHTSGEPRSQLSTPRRPRRRLVGSCHHQRGPMAYRIAAHPLFVSAVRRVSMPFRVGVGELLDSLPEHRGRSPLPRFPLIHDRFAGSANTNGESGL